MVISIPKGYAPSLRLVWEVHEASHERKDRVDTCQLFSFECKIKDFLQKSKFSKRFTCITGRISMNSANEMAKQMVGDQGECFTCGKILSNRWAAMRHFNLVHSKNQIMESDPCQECGKVFSNIQSLRDHLRRTHKVYASKSKYQLN